jgi:hypothetical protein
MAASASMASSHALYPTTRNISLKARRFIDHLVASFGDDPPWDVASATSGETTA